ncbi:hypothetical protein RhiirA5_416318 [Rhizophagus irregularis]|uniref:DDE-1 domain-containing protein n=1 Tax=Rhizophagus irregularis TaxID=588596 RepID=A0A2N0PQ26_9GLOM|nr:hypothetical protein RhiirA5_416318 [Rhizophagus irregularis]
MKNYIDYLVEEVDEPELLKMMVYDSFRGHLEESMKKKFCENGFNLAVIPEGLTSICQLLDVAINKPFKDNLRREWHLWIANVIIQSFKKCGISNSLNELKDIENNDVDKIIKKGDKELVIKVHENLVDIVRLQARFETITLEDDLFFEIELNFAMHNSEFVDFNKNDWV